MTPEQVTALVLLAWFCVAVVLSLALGAWLDRREAS